MASSTTGTISHSEAVMPTRRTFELVIITIVLAQPALAMVHLWFRKHLATKGPGVASDLAQVGAEVI